MEGTISSCIKNLENHHDYDFIRKALDPDRNI